MALNAMYDAIEPRVAFSEQWRTRKKKKKKGLEIRENRGSGRFTRRSTFAAIFLFQQTEGDRKTSISSSIFSFALGKWQARACTVVPLENEQSMRQTFRMWRNEENKSAHAGWDFLTSY